MPSSGLSFWLKGGAFSGDFTPSGAPAFEQSGQGVSLGAELSFPELLGDDRLHLGVLASYGSSTGSQTNGVSFDIEGWSLGAYAAYLSENDTPTPYDGLHLEAAAFVSLLDLSLSAESPAQSASYDATSWSATLAGGYGIEVAPGLILEPKGRLTYSRLQQDDFTDSLGVAVSLDDGESLEGVLALRLQKHWNLHGLGEAAPYVEASVTRQFLGANSIRADGVGFESNSEGTRYAVALGLDSAVGPDVSIYGSVELTWGDAVDQSVQAFAGLRLAF